MKQNQKVPLDNACNSLGTIQGPLYTSHDIADQQVIKKYVQNNNRSCALIKSGFVKQALQLLQTTEKQLKQKTKINKQVNEAILLATFHNLAAAHQKLGNFSQSLDFVRSILHHQHSKILALNPPNDFETRLEHLNININIAKYYLFFLSLTIQLKMFEASTIPANKTLQFFKKFCQSYNKFQLSLRLINTRLTEKIFSQIEQFQSLQSNSSFWELMQVAKQSIVKVQKLPRHFTKLNKFSLENLTNISQIQIDDSEKGIRFKYLGNRGFENGLMQFAVCLFLIGKSKNQSLALKQKSKQDQFQILSIEEKAKQYVLWSFHFACQLCPYLTPLHRQIYEYYELHFNKAEADSNGKKIKIIDSLQLPSLRDFDAWKDIKREMENIQISKAVKNRKNVKEQQNPIMTEKQFKNALQAQNRKNMETEDTITIRKKKQTSPQLFKTQRWLFEGKNKSKKNLNKVKSCSLSKQQFSNKKHEISRKKKETKKQIYGVQKKERKRNQSAKESTSQRNSVKSLKQKVVQNDKKWRQLMQDYFPKAGNKNKKHYIEVSKAESERKIVDDYLNLEKKIRDVSKSLSKKKKNLLKSVKNILSV